MQIKRINSLSFTDEKDSENKISFSQNHDFALYNIIFGLNGSGKSSISRLINSYSAKMKRERDKEIEGVVLLEDDTQLSTESNHSNILVFNSDFIAENIYSNLKDNYILIGDAGSINQEIEKFSNKITKAEAKIKKYTKKKTELYTNIQNDICHNTGFTKSKYNISNATNDMDKYNFNHNHVNTEEKINEIKELLTKNTEEYEKYSVLKETQLIQNFDSFFIKLKGILNQDKLQNQPIERLQNDTFLNSWIQDMYVKITTETEKYPNDKCPFCETTLITKGKDSFPIKELYENFKNHFNESYTNFTKLCKDFSKEVDGVIGNIDGSKNTEITTHNFRFINSQDNDTFKTSKITMELFYNQIKELLSRIKKLSTTKMTNILNNDSNNADKVFQIDKEYSDILQKYRTQLILLKETILHWKRNIRKKTTILIQ